MKQNKWLAKSCIVAEKRQTRPMISQDKAQCPFCFENKHLIEKVWVQIPENTDNPMIRIVNNKYPACTPNASCYGIHDVVIDTPNHTQHPKDFSFNQWEMLLEAMQKRWIQLTKDPHIHFIQIFKNYGSRAGASILHSHWQIVALAEVPCSVQTQYERFKQYKEQYNSCYLCDNIACLKKENEIIQTQEWVVLAPEVSQFMYETWVIPKIHVADYGKLNKIQLSELGYLLKKLLLGYDSLYGEMSFNICMMSGPVKADTQNHFYLKIAPRYGHMGGFEIATDCYMHTIQPGKHAKTLRDTLRE